jgi:hypothetical protein
MYEVYLWTDLMTYLNIISAKVFGIKLKLMKCRFELTYLYDLLTYFKTIIRAKVVMFGNWSLQSVGLSWPTFMTYRRLLFKRPLELRSMKVVMFGNKLKLVKYLFMLTYFYDLLTYLKTIRAKGVMFGIKLKLMTCMKCMSELTYFYDLPKDH